MHTVVIGNGIIGMTIAFRLANRAGSQDRVTVLGKKARPDSASLAAGAMLNSFGEIEKGSLEKELDLYRFEMSHLATKMWPKFEQELINATGSCLPSGCKKCQGFSGGGCVDTGTYVVNNTAADDLDDDNFDAILKALQDFNEPHRLVSPADIPNYMPEQRSRATRALYIENEGWYNPRLMLEKLDAALGLIPKVRWVDANADRMEGGANGVKAVMLDSGERIEADNFVVATGSSVTDLMEKSKLGIDVQRIFHGVGVSIEIRSKDYPHSKCIRTPNRGLACGIYTVPYFNDPNVPADHILVGASNLVSPVPVAHARISSVESLLRAAIEQINFNFYRSELIRVNVGMRPTSLDTYPLIGKTSIDNLVIVTGTKRDGFHMSPLISEQVVSIIYGEKNDDRLAWFAPERSPIRSMTRDEAIDKAIRHQMSAAYQHGFSPSTSRMSDQIRQMYRDDLERLHDQIGAIDWGIPCEMLDMYRYGHART
jgi:glycine/D-amino acid oxidase-like deaminating enzyme